MTGPEHYRKAERLLAGAEIADCHYENEPEDLANIAAAQVHATLALAAANGLNEAVAGMPEPDRDDWQDIAGHARPSRDGDL